jgi:mono/diheme cytochrome c family protein
MKTVKLLLVAVTLAACAFACGGSTTDPAANPNANARPTATVTQAPATTAATPDPLATARATYSQTCARCHKPDGTGGTAEKEDGKTIKVANLREHGKKDSDAELAKIISEGHDDMPAFGKRLDEKQINDLVRFIRVEFHGRADAASPSASPAR